MVKKGSFLKNVYSMVCVAMFIALYCVLSLIRFYIIPNRLRVSFTFLPIAWAAMLFGPFAGGMTGALGDILSWEINPTGPYVPGFTISGFITGIIYGLFFYNREIIWKRAILAATTMVLVVEVGLNSVWVHILNGNPYYVLIPERLAKALVTIPLNSVILYSTGNLVKKIAPEKMRGVL